MFGDIIAISQHEVTKRKAENSGEGFTTGQWSIGSTVTKKKKKETKVKVM